MTQQTVNCLTCRTGKRWWVRRIRSWVCPTCDGDPLKGNGREDWREHQRAMMLFYFGPSEAEECLHDSLLTMETPKGERIFEKCVRCGKVLLHDPRAHEPTLC